MKQQNPNCLILLDNIRIDISVRYYILRDVAATFVQLDIHT